MTTLWTDGPQKVKYSIQSVGEDEEEDDIYASGSFSVSETGLVEMRRPLDHERRRTHLIIVTNKTLTTPPALDYMTISVVVCTLVVYNFNPGCVGVLNCLSPL